jgi:hypothetical protein
MSTEQLTEQYRALIEPLLPFGKTRIRFQSIKILLPTKQVGNILDLLIEFQSKGGSLPSLAKALMLHTLELRRRVIMESSFNFRY